MRSLFNFYKWISNTKALEQMNGKYEKMFFEHVYRISYLAGQSSFDKSCLYQFYSYSVNLLIVLLLLSEMWFFFCDISTLDVLVDIINITLLQFLAIYKFKNMRDNQQIFKILAGAMKHKFFEKPTFKRRKLIEIWSTRSQENLKLVIGLGGITLAVWNVFPLLDDKEYNLALPIHLPIDYRDIYIYPIVYTLSQVAFTYVAGFIMIVDIIILTYLMHILCQYTILADCFENIITDCTFDDTTLHNRPLRSVGKKTDFKISRLLADRRFQAKYTERLNDLIVQHVFITNNTMDLRKILSITMLGQLATSTTLIASVAFQAAVSVEELSKFAMSCLFLGYNMFVLFTICRWCEDIKNQSNNISLAVYSSGWEDGLTRIPGVRTRLMLVITRASKPLVLTAGGMYDLTLVSFTSLIKASYSALTVLLRAR